MQMFVLNVMVINCRLVAVSKHLHFFWNKIVTWKSVIEALLWDTVP